MTAEQIMENIEALPPAEQAEVIRFVYRLDAERKLTGKELSSLAERMVHATDIAEAAILRETIMRGFYGGKAHA